MRIKWLGVPLFLMAIVNIVRYIKFVNRRYITLSIFLATGPLAMALVFREDFNNPGLWSRYHHIPVIGIILLIGLGLVTPNMMRISKYFQPEKIGWYFVILFVAINAGYTYHKNLNGIKGHIRKDLRTYEDLLGEACVKFSRTFNTNNIAVPDVKTSLPDFPFLRDLIYICRYSTPYSAHLNFKLSADDNRLFEILKSDDKFKPVLNRLKNEDKI